MDPLVQALKNARARIAKEEDWYTHGLARDKAGNDVHFMDEDACGWCLKGALYRESYALAPSGSSESEMRYFGLNFFIGIYQVWRLVSDEVMEIYNDRHSHADVLERLDEMIAIAERRSANNALASS